jgi:hypothetical protein
MSKILIIVLYVVLSACNAANKSNAMLQVDTLSNMSTTLEANPVKVGEPSTIVLPNGEQVSCYFPKNYHQQKNYPAIFFLDPHAEAIQVIEKYKALGEQYQCLLFASANSKNGLPIEESIQYVVNMVGYALQHFQIDTNIIYVSGFSGGAKVAMAFASQSKIVDGVIYCGAAIPINFPPSVTLIGFAGIKDMNYADVIDFDRQLNHNKHYLVEWNGIHAWPDTDVFADAFDVIEKSEIKNYASKRISTSDAVLNQEQQLKQQLAIALQQNDITWWNKCIAEYNQKKKSNMMYERLLGFISLACYTYVNQAIQQHNKLEAQRIFQIYRVADPSNVSLPEWQSKIEAM